jgi:hypothetical protein
MDVIVLDDQLLHEFKELDRDLRARRVVRYNPSGFDRRNVVSDLFGVYHAHSEMIRRRERGDIPIISALFRLFKAKIKPWYRLAEHLSYLLYPHHPALVGPLRGPSLNISKIHSYAWFVSNNPPIVSRTNFKCIPRTNFDFRSIGPAHHHPTGNDVADMRF